METTPNPIKDKEREARERRIIELKARKAQILEDLSRLEPAPLKQTTGISRRDFLKKSIVAGMGLLATNSSLIKSKEEPTAPTKENITLAKEYAPRTIEGEFSKCKEIIENKQYEKIMENPFLVSALYYSEDAIKKMTPPHKYRTEEIIWRVHSLVTREFRENYIKYLKSMCEGEVVRSIPRWPVPNGPSALGSDLEENHLDALDLFVTEGSPVFATTSGIVVLAESTWKEEDDLSTSSNRGGNVVIIFNPLNNTFSRYAHMGEVRVGTGLIIKGDQPEIIGTVGHSGTNASQPGHGSHVHFEINRYEPKEGIMIPINAFELKRYLEN